MVEQLVFIHIGKTAGTSIRRMLCNALGEESCSPPFVQSYMTEQDARYYTSFPVVCGHISRNDQRRWFPDRRVITLLREPIDRCLSFIHYVRSLPPEAALVAANAHQMSVLELIETTEAQYNLNNTMVRQLGGHMLDPPDDLPGLLRTAKETLSSASWIGLQHTLASDLRGLAALIGRPLHMEHANVTPARPPRKQEDPQVVDRLYSLNDFDFQLWDWAQRLVGSAREAHAADVR